MTRGKKKSGGSPQKAAVNGFTNDDRSKMERVLSSIDKLNSNFKSLIEHKRSCHEIIIQQHKEINALRTNNNVVLYQNDCLEQYGRRESIRIHNITNDLCKDASDIVVDIVNQIDALTPPDDDGNKLNINLTRADIHRCHFIGDETEEDNLQVLLLCLA